MVLPNKVGKQRSFGRGLLLTIITFGIYSIYWNYKAHNEVYEQFELKKEGKDEGLVFFIVGIFIGILYWIYQYKFVQNVNYVRQRMNLPEKISPAGFLLWSILGILIIVGPFIAYHKLQTSINEIWDGYDKRSVELKAQSPQAPPALKPAA